MAVRVLLVLLACAATLHHCHSKPQIFGVQLLRSDVTVKHFNLRNCGHSDDPVQVTRASVRSEGGNVVVSGHASVTRELDSPLKAVLKIVTKLNHLGRKITMPCTNGIGSCTYDDVCQFGIPADQACPAAAQQCRCPVTPGELELPEQSFPTGGLGEAMAGEYAIRVNVTNNDQPIACYDVSFQLI